ncbi:hypothetical protein CVT26_001252 [Gymnopilus dilepis]|uniref:F-box domain-containing protein n=1 Tax=Gymnopilus dilepis TaxID=231916 RepID=A0A409Y225_9AGAR|nr:hypothetical protein CVT26_001252 [Gymnopilus dilepis]
MPNAQQRRNASRVSFMESMFLRRDSKFIIDFFDSWTLQDIIALGKVNRMCHRIVELYARMKWNLQELITYYFSNPQQVMYMLEEEEHVLFGPAIFSFFDRRPFQSWPIDICIRVDSMGKFIPWLKREGYTYVDGPPGIASFETGVLGELMQTPDIKLKSTGDRNSSEEDRAAWGPYIFAKDATQAIRIKVYVVRCEPYRHILSLRATGMMNYVKNGYAVSLFPRSTFIHRRSFISRQDDIRLSFQARNEHFWLELNKGIFHVETIGLTHKPYGNVEIGRRYVGDADSWIISAYVSDEAEYPCQEEGPSFEVLDWTSATTRVDSFLRIGEPEIWSFELVLLKGDVSLILTFFDNCEPREVFALSSANKRLHSIVRFYARRKWSIKAFIGGFVRHPLSMLELLNDGDGIIFGPAVTKFFDRTLTRPSTIDICVHGRLLEQLLSLLEEEGYSYAGWDRRTINLEHYLWSKYAGTPTYDLRSSGERNHDEAHRSAWGPYEFARYSSEGTNRIKLHVVRCEPYRHILSLHSTGLMNMISWNRAISLFPISTFVYRRSFISAQDAIPAKQHTSDYKIWFDKYAASYNIDIIGFTHKVYNNVETGQRFVGDHFCWIIPYPTDDEYQNMHQQFKEFNGLSFEAIDWRSGATRPESYLRIGEPRIWSRWGELRDIQIHHQE